MTRFSCAAMFLVISRSLLSGKYRKKNGGYAHDKFNLMFDNKHFEA